MHCKNNAATTAFLQAEPATRQSFEALDVTYRRRSPNLSLRTSKCQSLLPSSQRNSQTNPSAPLSVAAFQSRSPPPMVSASYFINHPMASCITLVCNNNYYYISGIYLILLLVVMHFALSFSASPCVWYCLCQ